MGDQSNIQASVYGRIRNVNDVIQGISGSTLSEEQLLAVLSACGIGGVIWYKKTKGN